MVFSSHGLVKHGLLRSQVAWVGAYLSAAIQHSHWFGIASAMESSDVPLQYRTVFDLRESGYRFPTLALIPLFVAIGLLVVCRVSRSLHSLCGQYWIFRGPTPIHRWLSYLATSSLALVPACMTVTSYAEYRQLLTDYCSGRATLVEGEVERTEASCPIHF